jgi:hypothetical protein
VEEIDLLYQHGGDVNFLRVGGGDPESPPRSSTRVGNLFWQVEVIEPPAIDISLFNF